MSSQSLGDLKELVYAANLELVRAGLVVLTWGNASGVDRERGIVAIKPSGVAYDALRPEDIVLVSLETGQPLPGERLRPSSDTPTHVCLYQRFPGIGGIAHTHSRYATSWAQACREIPCYGTTHADTFHGVIPLCRPLTPQEVEDAYEWNTGVAIAEHFQANDLDPAHVPGTLLPFHAPLAWGGNAGAGRGARDHRRRSRGSCLADGSFKPPGGDGAPGHHGQALPAETRQRRLLRTAQEVTGAGIISRLTFRPSHFSGVYDRPTHRTARAVQGTHLRLRRHPGRYYADPCQSLGRIVQILRH